MCVARGDPYMCHNLRKQFQPTAHCTQTCIFFFLKRATAVLLVTNYVPRSGLHHPKPVLFQQKKEHTNMVYH